MIYREKISGARADRPQLAREERVLQDGNVHWDKPVRIVRSCTELIYPTATR